MKAAAIIVAGMVAGVILGAAAMWVDVAYAAPPQPDTVPVSDNCVHVAEVGIIDTFYCEMPYGPDVIINSLGFMAVVE